jgi:glutamyl-tRNA synthetase
MHIGTARTGYFNWLAAKASGGTFLLRIDDTNVERSDQAHTDVIYKSMDWLGLDYDTTFKQSERRGRYEELLKALLDAGSARYTADGAVALVCPDSLPASWIDEVAGEIPITETNIAQIKGTVEGRTNDGLILARQEGSPTYQFASVVDDFDYEINYIIRGVDHISNTPKQIAIWTAINGLVSEKSNQWSQHWTPLPKFAHIGLIFKDKKKMSKRDGAASMASYEVYEREAVLNFMLRMGWAPREDNKVNSIISRDRAVEMFLTEGRMRNSNANFDQAKLEWYDREYEKRKAA